MLLFHKFIGGDVELIDRLDLIKNLTFFATLNNEQLSMLNDISNVVEYNKNSILYYEKESHNKIFFLITGLLKVYKIDKYENEIFLYHVYSNSLISELTTLDSTSISCFSNAEFIENSVVLEVDFSKFKKKFLSKNILINEFINEILLKTQQLHSVVNRELVFDASAKVSFMLVNDLDMFNRLKRQDVSFMLHIQPETLSRVLKKLKRESVISVENSKVVILNRDILISTYER